MKIKLLVFFSIIWFYSFENQTENIQLYNYQLIREAVQEHYNTDFAMMLKSKKINHFTLKISCEGFVQQCVNKKLTTMDVLKFNEMIKTLSKKKFKLHQHENMYENDSCFQLISFPFPSKSLEALLGK